MKYFEAPHYRQLTFCDWIEWGKVSSNFTPKELSSKGDASIKIEVKALRLLQGLRDLYNAPLVVNSAYRDPAHNIAVGGSPKSQHVLGRAFDLHIENVDVGRVLEEMAIKVGFSAIGRYKTFIHVDCRPSKPDGSIYQWGSWS